MIDCPNPVRPRRRSSRDTSWLKHLAQLTACLLLTVACSSGSDANAICDQRDQWTEGVDLIVMLELQPAAEDIASVEATLQQHGDVEFIDEDAAYAEFLDLFRDSDQLGDTVEQGEVPASFRVRLTNSDAVDQDSALVSELHSNRAVQEVILSTELVPLGIDC